MPSFSLKDISPDVLIWARDNSGYTVEEAAKKIGVSEAMLTKWESEASEIPYGKLRKMAEHYRVTTPILFLNTPPNHVKKIVDRRRGEELSPEYVREEKLAIKRAYDYLLTYQTLTGGVKTELPVITREVDKIPHYASQIRELLGISLEQQEKFRTEHETFKAWRESIEARGVLVFQESFHQLSGFTLSARDPGVIFINSGDNIKRRAFTLMHELCHLLLNDGSISNAKEYDGQNDAVEVFCNKFAAELLVPKSVLESRVQALFPDGKTSFDLDSLDTLANTFHVSSLMLLVRLSEHGFVSETSFNTLAKELHKRSEEYKKAKPKDLMIKYHIRHGNKLSRLYTKGVLRSYDSGQIGLYNALSHLRIGATHLANLRSYLKV